MDARDSTGRWNKGNRRADYSIQVHMHPRFGDVDMHRHLNNVAQARFYEEGVARFHRVILDGLWNDGTSVIGEVRIRYLSEGRYPGALILYGGVCHIGNASYAIEQTLWQEDRQISICQTTSIYRKQNASCRLPEVLRARLDRYLLRSLVE